MGQMYDPELVKRRLKDMAYQLRQDAIKNGDMESWRISRLIREVSTMEQAREMERRLRRWRGL
ncbi:hypothetical protein [Afipia felis]|uniref:Uncharacterized protein n=2 Tax=Afipia felis TaxID=1035 RepID=A0A380WCD6_AFIFE|nr:hypothetical protein [Afipia felis]EKS29892.1 hypothetical protein HMPREF9697_02420 [Afipia felis ATCC 53690]SUU78599.1 Uncharacterised protein [Afipia felis]SUU86664.1 Uncharacterised protein [Afipia felis]